MKNTFLPSVLVICVFIGGCQLAETPTADEQLTQAITYKEGGNQEKAIKMARSAAEQGNAEAQVLLGNLIFDENKEEAQQLWQSAAEQGNLDGKFHSGLMAYFGKDYEEALGWIKPAAEEGHAGAQYLLSEFYQNGYGVPVDFDTAVYWLEKSAAQEPSAQNEWAIQQLRSMKNQGLLQSE